MKMSKKTARLVALLMSIVMVLSMGLTSMAAQSPISARFEYEDASGDAVDAANTAIKTADKVVDGVTYITAATPIVYNVVFYQNDEQTDYEGPATLNFTDGIKPNTLYLIMHQKTDGTWEKFFVQSTEDGVLTVTLDGIATVAIVELKEQKKVTEIFIDIHEGEWWEPSVQVVFDNDAMIGTGTGETFDPTGALTRDQFVQVLYNIEGKPEVDGSCSFTDVKEGGWYRNAVVWAANCGVTVGKTSTFFGVNQKITRQELIQMLYKYAKLKGLNTSVTEGCLDKFSDKDKVSDWAKEAVSWAVSQGIVSGTGDGRLDPRGSATRAECAVMIAKLLNM